MDPIASVKNIALSMAYARERHLKEMADLIAQARQEGAVVYPFAYKDYYNSVTDASSELQGAVKNAAERMEDDRTNSGDGFTRTVSADRRDYMAYRG